MAWLMVLQAAITLWLTWCCWRYAKRADEVNASLWQGLAELRMNHNALEGATADAFGEVDARFDEFELDAIPIAPPPPCSCKKCRDQRALRVN